MLEELFGNATIERALLYLTAYGDAYPTGVAKTFGLPVSMVQKQLARLERGGIVASQLKGRTRLYTFNPRYPLVSELSALLARAMQFVPPPEKKAYYTKRRRPRRQGKGT